MKSKRHPFRSPLRSPLPKGILSNYKTLIPYLYRCRFQYIAGFVCLLIVDAAQIGIPLFLQQAIDSIVAGGFCGGISYIARLGCVTFWLIPCRSCRC
ncbi:MAG: hypothetical protein LBK73_05480 [Treponema sp.]|nr:hypothetical protein [Treponema sp.]